MYIKDLGDCRGTVTALSWYLTSLCIFIHMAHLLDVHCESITIHVFKEVQNADELCALVLQDGEDSVSESLRGAVIDLSLVVSAFHLKQAAFRALTSEKNGTMKTKSLSSEILYCLAATCKISEALKQYRINSESRLIAVVDLETTTSMLETSATAEVITISSVLQSIVGVRREEDFLNSEDFQSPDKRSSLMAVFKLHADEVRMNSLEDAIATRLAAKDI